VNADEDSSDEEDVESQDKEDVGYRSHPGDGFTSAVSIHLHVNSELKYFVDNLKGCCTAQLASSPEEAVGP
jgi:hypothetical protein